MRLSKLGMDEFPWRRPTDYKYNVSAGSHLQWSQVKCNHINVITLIIVSVTYLPLSHFDSGNSYMNSNKDQRFNAVQLRMAPCFSVV